MPPAQNNAPVAAPINPPAPASAPVSSRESVIMRITPSVSRVPAVPPPGVSRPRPGHPVPGVPPGPHLPAHRGQQVQHAGQEDPQQIEGAQRVPGEPGHHSERGAHPGGHPLARAVARGPRGGQSALLRVAGHGGNVRHAGAAARHDGQGAADPEGDELQSGLRQRPDGGPEVVQEIQSVQQHPGPQPGLGPLLPRLQEDLQAAAPADPARAPVRLPQAVDVPRPGVGHARVLPPQPEHHQDHQRQLQPAGDHQQAEAAEAVYARERREGVHVPPEGARGPQTGREGDAVLLSGQLPPHQRPRDSEEEPDHSEILRGSSLHQLRPDWLGASVRHSPCPHQGLQGEDILDIVLDN